MPGTSDEPLVQRAALGDRDAFDTLAASVLSWMTPTAFLIVGSHDAAEDAVQEALVKAWVNLPGLRDPSRFRSWLRQLLVNACRDHLRDVRRSPTASGTPELPQHGEDEMGRMLSRDEIDRVLRLLSVDHRTVIVLKYYLSLSTAEIAVAVGVPTGTVKSRLFFAMQQLRAALDANRRPWAVTHSRASDG